MINAAMIGLGWWGKHSIDSIKMSEKINNSETVGFKELMRMKIYGT